MARSVKRLLSLLLIVGAVTLGFTGGRALYYIQPNIIQDASRTKSLILSATRGDAFANAARLDEPDSSVPPADIFESVLDHIQRDFVEGVHGEGALSNGAMARMLASLNDPKTHFLEPNMRRVRQDALSGRFQGIGAVVGVTSSKKADVDYRHLSVISVMPGSPAEKAGLKTGDRITEINGQWIIAYSILVEAERIKKMSVDDARKLEEAKKVSEKFKAGHSLSKALTLLTSGEGKALKLTVERAGQAPPLKMDITTAVTEVNPVEFRMVKSGVGYLRVRQFNQRATEAFQAALNRSQRELKTLIVDLRSNPGGVRSDTGSINGYDSALKLIGRLTPGGSVATIERKPNKREPLTVPQAKPASKVSLIVLVDSGTANLSELVASALRDAAKAKIVGTPTFGDPILQYFTALKDGSGVEIANARLLTVKGSEWKQGVQPDVVVAANAPGTDPILARALTLAGA